MSSKHAVTEPTLRFSARELNADTTRVSTLASLMLSGVHQLSMELTVGG